MEASEARTILESARALIAEPERFTTGTWARDAAGHPVSATDPGAVTWDGDGAVRKVMGAYEPEMRAHLMLALRKGDRRSRYIGQVGDEDGHAAVLRAFDEAIAAMTAEDAAA